MIYSAIDRLVQYGIDSGLIDRREEIYTRNLLLEVMGEESYVRSDGAGAAELSEILRELTDIAVERGHCADTAESRDIFDTKLMNCLTPRPREVCEIFRAKYAKSVKAATDWFYQFSGDTNYIRRDRIRRDRRWRVQSPYGDIDITINLSKPEKDPRDIAAAGRAKGGTAYPRCQLCVENEGYAGRIGHPARANHRVIPVDICGESWCFQYSPYVYYNEHCIVFNSAHTPMTICKEAFDKLFAFVEKFPHYFVGSNADLPIVGGSILSHEHFQGGNYEFAMARAETEKYFTVEGFEDVECGILRWPLSVIRLSGEHPGRLSALGDLILQKWRGYTDEAALIFAETDGEPHNTITPIARRRGETFELDLCLRNNLTTDEHPMGLYHPHAQRHHIKKENIGLIEVMGLAVLPSRLNRELELLEEYIAQGRDIGSNEVIAKHAQWARSFVPALQGQPPARIRKVLEEEVGKVFVGVLEDAGVYPCTPAGRAAFQRFIDTI